MKPDSLMLDGKRYKVLSRELVSRAMMETKEEWTKRRKLDLPAPLVEYTVTIVSKEPM